MNQNEINVTKFLDNNTISLKQQYNNLKQKVANLEKNNLEMIEIYKSEEERLIKSNEFLMKKSNHEHSNSIQELESKVLKMKNNIQKLQKLIDKKNNSNPNLIEDDDNEAINNDFNNNYVLNNSMEKKEKNEYLINYKNKLKSEFEQKLIMKHKELVDYYIKRNNEIKQNKGNEEDIFNIDEIKYFSIKEISPEESESPKSKNTTKKITGFEELVKNINENEQSENKEINIDKVNKILSLLCLKEKYPKKFFIDYILDESYSQINNNKKDTVNKLLELEKDEGQDHENELEKFIENSPKRKSVFTSVGFSTNKISNRICKLFDIINEYDKEIIKSYLNKIILNNNNLRHYFEKNFMKYRFTPYEPEEIEKYDEKIKNLFEKEIFKLQNLLNFDNNIITLDLFEEFIKKYFYSNDINEELTYYCMSLMKFSKKERKEEKNKRIKSLGLFEFYLIPLFQKVNN